MLRHFHKRPFAGNLCLLVMATLSGPGTVASAEPTDNTNQQNTYAEVVIKPQHQSGTLEITCHDVDSSQSRLVMTAITIQVTTPSQKTGDGNTPYFLGWYIDNQRPTKELWVGVELPAGSKMATVSLTLPFLLKSVGQLKNDLLLSIRTDVSSLGEYFSASGNELVYAPIRSMTLDFSGTRLHLVDSAGWQKEGIDRLVWRRGEKQSGGAVLEAKFRLTGPFDEWIILIGGGFGGLMFGLFLANHVLLNWISSKRGWSLFGASFVIAALFMFYRGWIAQLEIALPVISFGFGIIIGSWLKPVQAAWVKSIADPTGASPLKSQ